MKLVRPGRHRDAFWSLAPWDPTCQGPQKARFSFPPVPELCFADLLLHLIGDQGHHNFTLTTTNTGTGLHILEQLFLFGVPGPGRHQTGWAV